MSTEYLPVVPIPVDRLLNELGRMGLREGESTYGVSINDGKNFLWVNRGQSGFATFTRNGANRVEGILEAIAEHFQTDIVSEYDDEFEKLIETLYAEDYGIDPEDNGEAE